MLSKHLAGQVPKPHTGLIFPPTVDCRNWARNGCQQLYFPFFFFTEQCSSSSRLSVSGSPCSLTKYFPPISAGSGQRVLDSDNRVLVSCGGCVVTIRKRRAVAGSAGHVRLNGIEAIGREGGRERGKHIYSTLGSDVTFHPPLTSHRTGPNPHSFLTLTSPLRDTYPFFLLDCEGRQQRGFFRKLLRLSRLALRKPPPHNDTYVQKWRRQLSTGGRLPNSPQSVPLPLLAIQRLHPLSVLLLHQKSPHPRHFRLWGLSLRRPRKVFFLIPLATSLNSRTLQSRTFEMPSLHTALRGATYGRIHMF